MPVEELLEEYKKERELASAAMKRQDEILAQIVAAKDADWDMVSVKKAAQKAGVSVGLIYQFVTNGKLVNVQRKNTKLFVSMAELKALNDK